MAAKEITSSVPGLISTLLENAIACYSYTEGRKSTCVAPACCPVTLYINSMTVASVSKLQPYNYSTRNATGKIIPSF